MYTHIEEQGIIIRDSDGAVVAPFSEENRLLHYDYVNYVNQGGIVSSSKKEVTPMAVSMRKAQRELLNRGMLDTVENAINSLEGVEGRIAQIEWRTATTVERHSPVVLMIANLLGLTDEEIDTLFIEADKIA